jgi:ribose transport system substrate-binding protein
MLVTVSACHRSDIGSGHQQEEYVMVATNIDLPYWAESRRGFEDAARELGVKARFIGTPGYNPAEQAKLFTSAAWTRPAGMLVAPADPDVLKEPIDGATQIGVPVACVDTDSPASSRLFFVGTSNREAGVQGGELLAKALDGSGEVVLLTIPRQWNLAERVLGYQEALKNYPGIRIVDILNDAGDPGRASAVIPEVLRKHPGLKGIGALDAAGGPGAAEALRKAGKQLIVVAMDMDPPTLQLVRDGLVWATIAQKPYTMSYYGLKMMHDLHHNSVRIFLDWRLAQTSPLPLRIDTGTALITRNNVAAFMR